MGARGSGHVKCLECSSSCWGLMGFDGLAWLEPWKMGGLKPVVCSLHRRNRANKVVEYESLVFFVTPECSKQTR